jgi:hypothetical protein
MNAPKTVDSIKDLNFGKADMVFSHKGCFTETYKSGEELGRGNKLFHCRCFWRGQEMPSSVDWSYKGCKNP